jgi:hypothetical protein
MGFPLVFGVITTHVTEYGLTISVQKTKSMAYKGRDPVRTKIVIDNKIMEKVNSFNYLGNIISYEKELDSDNILHNYLKITSSSSSSSSSSSYSTTAL